MLLHGTLVWLQLCKPQGVALFSFVCPPPRVPYLFAGAPVYDMSLTHVEWLRAVGCGLKGKLVRLLLLGVGRHFEPQRNRGTCRKMMQSNVRCVAAGLAAAVLERAVKEAKRLLAARQCAAAALQLQRAIILGHMPSRAHLADLFLRCREGFAQDNERAFALAEEGARLGCHCQGVLADFYYVAPGCSGDAAWSPPLARESASKDNTYGQIMLGRLYRWGEGGVAQGYAAAVAQYQLAAAQGYDEAQCCLGHLYLDGQGVARDYTAALRLYKLAAAQGCGWALFSIGHVYMKGHGVAADEAGAIHWLKRAAESGHRLAAHQWKRLGA